MPYTGLPQDLKEAVWERDNYRCRWCGATNQGVDIHHIEYRRGYQQDRLDNLVTLCREHHGFVHDSYAIPKHDAQDILFKLIGEDGAGWTGMALWRHSESGTMAPTGTVGRLL